MEAAKEQGTGQVTHLGFDDLSGQLRGALDQYAGATRVAFSWIAAILVLYIAIIGPGDSGITECTRRYCCSGGGVSAHPRR